MCVIIIKNNREQLKSRNTSAVVNKVIWMTKQALTLHDD